jgi:LysR family transcriptional regulator, transcriptional activator of the cysJI operon
MQNFLLFRDIAHHRSFSRGATLNRISQSAASQHLQELERSLGVDLIDRSTRPLRLTDAGRLYLDYCRDMLRRHDEFEADLNRLKREVSGKVRLAAIYSVGLSEMSRIEAEFSARFPDGLLEVSYLRPEKVFQAVEEDRAELGLLSYAESTRDVVALPWREEEMVVAVDPGHSLAQQTEVEPSELAGCQFISFDDDLPIQARIERYLRERHVSVQHVLHFDNLQMIKEAVAHGAGISILPERVMREELAAGRLVAIRLKPSELFRPVRIIHRRRKVFSELAAGLMEILQEGDGVATALPRQELVGVTAQPT